MIDTKKLAEEIVSGIQYAMQAHIYNPKTDNDTFRFWDRKTPYIIHPTWCAMTLLTETSLDEGIRINGYKALLWHDILEDTKITELPDETPENVQSYVREMTFNSFSEEKESIWEKDKVIRLLKLYDKTSNLLDGVWMKDEKWNGYVKFTSELSKDVLMNYGNLNIVKIANALAIKR